DLPRLARRETRLRTSPLPSPVHSCVQRRPWGASVRGCGRETPRYERGRQWARPPPRWAAEPATGPARAAPAGVATLRPRRPWARPAAGAEARTAPAAPAALRHGRAQARSTIDRR